MIQKVKLFFAVRRIRRMEQLFDDLLDLPLATIRQSVREKRKLRKLTRYYESRIWREDFERDERGELPAALKRGVLSEDGLYNFLSSIKTDD